MQTIVLENREIVTVLAPADHADYNCHRTGVVYVFQDGSDMWSSEPMTASELQVHKSIIDSMADEPEYDDEDQEPYYTLGEPRMAW